jgi:hypothetical protein
VLLAFLIAALSFPLHSQTPEPAKPMQWKSVSFAIVRFNDEAPQSWNIYHTSKRGVLLVKLWKRYLLVNVADEQVFDIDPHTVRVQGDSVEWSTADTPAEPLKIADWRVRDVGPVERVRFRLGKDGHILELQLPLRADGKPAY